MSVTGRSSATSARSNRPGHHGALTAFATAPQADSNLGDADALTRRYGHARTGRAGRGTQGHHRRAGAGAISGVPRRCRDGPFDFCARPALIYIAFNGYSLFAGPMRVLG